MFIRKSTTTSGNLAPSSAQDENVGVLQTKFVTQEQSAALNQVLDLALGDLDQVGGGVQGTLKCPPRLCTIDIG